MTADLTEEKTKKILSLGDIPPAEKKILSLGDAPAPTEPTPTDATS